MFSQKDFDSYLRNHIPFLVYNPQGLKDVSLIKTAIKAGGFGLIDFDRINLLEMKDFLEKSSQELVHSWGVRVNSEEQLDLVLNFYTNYEPLIIVIGDFQLTEKTKGKIQQKPIILFAEVTSLAEAYEKKWARAFIVKGNEAAGRIGDETTFILCQQFANAGLSFIPQGGLGLFTTAAVFGVGAKAVIFDTQLYLLKDCPLNSSTKHFLSTIDSTDTKIIGNSSKMKYRVYAKLGTKIVNDFSKKEKELLLLSIDERTVELKKILFEYRAMFDAEDIANCLLPIGQDIAFAKTIAHRYNSISEFFTGLLDQIKEQITNCMENYPFKENSPFAKELGIKYPLIQGPMANVSECPSFAKIVANNGGLPFLALGSLFRETTKKLILKTKQELNSLPFGCGIIGLEANKKAREEHLKILKELKPPFVVVAAGTIEQAKEVMSYGIKTFLHTPSPAIFSEALFEKIDYLILEGMECGGHIGLLTSFVLWELALHELIKNQKELEKKQRSPFIAFAGGIGDKYSAAMVGLISSAITKIAYSALYIGSAYLLTKEIVECGAIQPLYQQLALNCKETMILGETVNTRARCIPTPFAQEIIKREMMRLQNGIELNERKHLFEKDNLGATRIAALGQIWNPDGEDDKPNRFNFVGEEIQYQKGNYLIGQIVANIHTIKSIQELHKELIELPNEIILKCSLETLKKLNLPESKPLDLIRKDAEKPIDFLSKEKYPFEGVAVIGLGCFFPDAHNIPKYWDNILNKVNSIKEIPKERWADDIDLFYSEDKLKPNKSYAKIAAAITNFEFNSLDFKIPPKVSSTIGRAQKYALIAAKEALTDIGFFDKKIDTSRFAVIIGNSMGDEIRESYTRKIYIPEVLKSIEKTPSFKRMNSNFWSNIKEEVLTDYESRLVEINEDSMPGELSNIIAGRIANIFDLNGKNMTTDAACASSLAALSESIKGLLDKEYDNVLCGGSDCSLDPSTFVKFAKIGALSADGSYPFDERANGFVMGEGAGFVVLKRLSDAIKDNDKIYAVIRGIGASSDGRGKGITAPNPKGEKLAIERALNQAKLTISDVQLIEAHGTSTKVGDAVEIEVLNNLAKDVKPSSIAIGSVKSQIGHLKSAAGIAALIKSVLSLYHKKLPPSINFQNPNKSIIWDVSPFYVNTETKNWNRPEKGNRVAGVSSFGFGGTNFHVILEEYIPQVTQGNLPLVMDAEEIQKYLHFTKATNESYQDKGVELNYVDWQNYIRNNINLETEAIFLGEDNYTTLEKSLNQLKINQPKSTFEFDGKGIRVRDFSINTIDNLRKKIKMGFVCKSFANLNDLIENSLDGLRSTNKRALLTNKGIFYSDDHKVEKIAFLFPGQGSQYIGMGKELYAKFEIVRETFREADEISSEILNFKISEAIFGIGKTEAESLEELRQTEITQPAIFVVDIAIFRLLKSFGIEPDFIAGHSLGEYAALVASGILSYKDGLLAVIPRGQAMAKFDSKDKGLMASISAGIDEVERFLPEINGYVIAANKNSPNQTVISGDTIAVQSAVELFTKNGINASLLQVSGAFHSNIVAPAVDFLRTSLEKLNFNKPLIPISSNVTGELYPEKREEMIELLCKQITSPVEWIKQICKMYDNYGITTYIEVGPKSVLTSFVKAILEKKKDVLPIASIHPKKGELQHFYEVLTALGIYGYPIKVPSLNNAIYSKDFLNPLEKFYIRKMITKIEEPLKVIEKETPLKSLLDPELNNLANNTDFQEYLELNSAAIRAFLKTGYETYKNTISKAMKEMRLIEKLNFNAESIGVTGISLGLPGKNRRVFDASNFNDILSGKNFIDPITVDSQEKMVDKNIVRLVKDSIKGAQFQPIKDIQEVIKLAAQKGQFDLSKEYGIDIELTEILDITFQLAFAAGIEALRDAGIPLVPLKTTTSIGKELTKSWALPESLREDTGIIFASAFPGYSNLISTISKYLTNKYERKNKNELNDLFNELIYQIKDKTIKEKVKNWFDENKRDLIEKESQFEFNRKFLFEVLSMGHSQFAQFIKAKGPNTQVNAACSSTTQAIAIGEDWIRTGRCKRVLIIGADDVTNEQMLEWIASGFLAVGAATTLDKIENAALPFDKRRHGMIIGMGAVGIVLESELSMKTRGVKPIVDLLGTHIVNSAFHGSRLDGEHISNQMNDFMSKIEKRYSLLRDEIAKELVFVSHETYTPARGGSASAEVDALRKTFGQTTDRIIIANTKGFTGHAMGAGIEDVVAVKILETGIVPPIANWKEQDPELGYLNLSKGGKYNVKYALRFAAGFGSQLTMALFKLNSTNERFASSDYDSWLVSLGGSRKTLEISNGTLRLREDLLASKKNLEVIPIITGESNSLDGNLVKSIISLVSEKTGYPIDMIQPDMRLEEDLGIDTVKQAELFGIIRSKYNLPREEGIRIQDYFSVNKIAIYINSKLTHTLSTNEKVPIQNSVKQKDSIVTTQQIADEIIVLISEKTGYPINVIDRNMQLEEDLGIDTVKQAEIFGIIRAKYNLPREEGIRIQDYSNVNKITDFIVNRLGKVSELAIQNSEVFKATSLKDEKVSLRIPPKRYTIKLVKVPKIKVEEVELTKKQFLIFGPNNDFRKQLQIILEKRKAIILKSIEIEKNILEKIPEQKIDGLIFIIPKTNSKNKHFLTTKILFNICKKISFNESPIILTIHNSTSAFGWNEKIDSIIGSVTGFTKALAREFNHALVKTISSNNPELIIEELCKGDGSVEISFTEDGQKQVFMVEENSIVISDKNKLILDKNDLLLITGGAQGITYEITKKIAEKYKSNIAILGRTELPSNILELINLDMQKLDALKNNLILKMKTEDEKVTPVKIENEWSKIIKAINIQKAINNLTNLGSKTKYYSIDVSDLSLTTLAIKQIKDDFQQEITGIIHGAGLESSKLLQDKKVDDFNKIYDVKALGFDNIINNINLKKIRFLICFSSIAGCFGNAGQIDYSAANDYLSKSCWQLRNQGVRATSICWSAWSEVGMATRGSIMDVLKIAGVTPIEINDGVDAFINELEYGQEPEVIIAGKIGILLESPLPFSKVNKNIYPLIDGIKRNFDGSIVAERIFSLETDLYLDHHRFENVPYLPGVIGLELFAELAKLAFPNKKLSGFEKVEFNSAVKFYDNESKLLRAKISPNVNPSITLESIKVKNDLRVGEPKIHFKANALFNKKRLFTKLKIKLSKKNVIDKKTIYEILPHGPLFQIVKEIKDINNNSITASASIENNKYFTWDFNGFIINPLAIEAGFQTAGLFDILKENKMGLPYSIGSIEITENKDDSYSIIATKKDPSISRDLFDFVLINKEGDVIMQIIDYSTVKIELNANNEKTLQMQTNEIKKLFNLPDGSSIEVINTNLLKNLLQKNPNLIETFLHFEEIKKYNEINIEKRKYDWLAGVLAVKKALLKIEPMIQANSIIIEKTDEGKPKPIKLPNKKSYFISITHSNGFAVGIVNASFEIGIDLEKIESRAKSFSEEVISSQDLTYIKEQKKEITEELLTKIWAAKEAVTKILGIGLAIDLHNLLINKLQDNKITIIVDSSKLPSQFMDKKQLEFLIDLSQNSDFVAAVCSFKHL